MDDSNIAVYLDFENLVLSAEEIYPSKEKPLKMSPIIDYIASKGNICLRKAYANWSNQVFSRYQRDLIETGFEMIHLPGMGFRQKSGADVKLAVDAIEAMEMFDIVDTYVIGSGDTDFIPLIQQLRARGKIVIVMGFDHNVGTLVKRNCTEYKRLEDILGEHEEEAVSDDISFDTSIEYARDLMIRYTNTLSHEGPVQMSNLKLDLLRLDPSFSEKKFGFKSFKKFVEHFEGDIVSEIKPDPTSELPQVYFNEIEPMQFKEKPDIENAKQFLKTNLKFQFNRTKTDLMAKTLLRILNENDYCTMKEMADLVSRDVKGIPKVAVRKFINALWTGHAFKAESSQGITALASRSFKLKDGIVNSDMIRNIYYERIEEIITGKYPELEYEEIRGLIHRK